jgi:hypothetical protein
VVHLIPERIILERALALTLASHPLPSWGQPNTVFPFLVALLEDSETHVYCYATICGLVSAVGGLTESVSKEAIASLLGWCRYINSELKFVGYVYHVLIFFL